MPTADEARCYEKLTTDDLRVIRDSALPELERFLTTKEGKYGVYRDRLLGMCLCMDGAKHYQDGATGFKHLDVFFFFREHPSCKIPHQYNMRKSIVASAGNSGQKPFDLMKKQIPERYVVSEEPAESIRNYLKDSQTAVARMLAKQPVIGLYPHGMLWTVIWSAELDID